MKPKLLSGLLCVITACVASAKQPAVSSLSDKERLGKAIFNDINLSQPAGQSCATCHSAKVAFSDPDKANPTSEGVLTGRFGPRNAPSIAYSSFSPPLYYDVEGGTYVGGQFWDGRADDLIDQAERPLFNPIEMHNHDPQQVVAAIRKASYAPLFQRVFGADSLHPRKTGTPVLRQALDAIAAYEASHEVARFSSKFDFVTQGKAKFTAQEELGLRIYNGKANCAACHPSTPNAGEPAAMFTDFTYDNIGIPKNWKSPFLTAPRDVNPDGEAFIDTGLAATVSQIDPRHAAEEAGKFKVPSLRNVAITGPYGHNGYFRTLRVAVDFYNARDVPEAGWPEAEVPETMNTEELGHQGMTQPEIDALLVFLNTLTDGYKPR